MKLNMPVTQIEHHISDTDSIVSTTDLQGNITYANPYFIEVSGFTEDELIGAPQNIVRHPDMPTQAFADLWSTIQSGLPWSGVVKNRCKNGDFYWVFANVTPVIENGKAVGYVSVRTKPSVSQIQEASRLYSSINKGNPENLELKQGRAYKKTKLAQLSEKFRLTMTQRLAINFVLLAASFLLAISSQWISTQWIAALLAICAANAIHLWFHFHRTITIPSKQALAASKIMAGGDLSARIDTERTDDLGQLIRMLRQLQINLNSIVGDVRKNSEHIRSATKEIATGNMDLSGRTESQASSLEETAASMEEFSSTVAQNSDNTVLANQMANEAMKIAEHGGKITGQMVNTMDEISQSSKRMIDITGLIEGIAFQTNILALNAAVEAARAGEQGRGFAVVASEVRNLAQRSAAAAKEIKELIDVTLIKIHAGSQLTSQAGSAMQEIISSNQKVSGIIGDIASASREQSQGIHQVNDAITHMDEVTQQNAALVEEAAAAAMSLELQTDTLVKALSIFKLSDNFVSANIFNTNRASKTVTQDKKQTYKQLT
ncbi:PAS domain-containing protein [Undibacterium amnicola]|uniref:PAS domain-containing protein n=1 Tax=Undibacterium amnicola TaxID=1834038 RepID=A0ABR6XMX1_9BURK|nr:PAS domain-containing methyl-accepting chemotaxis protein [Undibacterium amnicola]MBC3830860.1 PAS domain-containing protein [Undibacterium amnicola]